MPGIGPPAQPIVTGTRSRVSGRQISGILRQGQQISADATLDTRAQKALSAVKGGPDGRRKGQAGAKDMIPGSPFEAFLPTETRTGIFAIHQAWPKVSIWLMKNGKSLI